MADEPPILFHERDVLFGEAGGEVEFAVGDPLINLLLGHGPAIYKYIQNRPAALDAESVERQLAMIVQLEKRPIAAIGGAVRREGDNVALGDGGHFFDEDLASGGFGLPAGGENAPVLGVGLEVGAKGGAGLPGGEPDSEEEKREEGGGEAGPAHGRLIKGLTHFATLADYLLMRRTLVALLLLLVTATGAWAQGSEDATGPERRGWFSRLNPFSRGEKLTEYTDPKLNGLVLTLEIVPQPIKLSEVRQMNVKITLTNKAKRPITLEFPDSQRFEIYLRNAADTILTTWSDNHAFAEVIGSVFINPQEHIEYNETIATRELTANKVFTAEVFFPKYPELRVRQKFLTAP